MGAELIRVSVHEPCAICGKTDWCFRFRFDDGATTHQCYRDAGLCQQDTTGADGRLYRFKKIATSDLGTYGMFQEMQEYQHYNELWRQEHGYSGKSKNISSAQTYVPLPEIKRVCKDWIDPLPPEKLDEVYRYFLSLLVLEEWHEKLLRREWGKGIEPHLADILFATYPIRTLPPEDKVRFQLKAQHFKNPTRKAVMEKMVARFGDLKGVPGFFQRTYDNAWTFTSTNGILYPIFNTYGQMIRLRIADEYPKVFKINEQGEKEGHYQFSYKTAEWFFFSMDETKAPVLVESQSKNIHKVALSEKGYPAGKVDGKYKNFSSRKDRKEVKGNVEYTINCYLNGTKSGSYCSLYYRKGDDFHTVYITEGEKKGMVANILFGVPVIILPGVGAFASLLEPQDGYDKSILDFIREMGCKNLVLAYDSDKYTNKQVLVSEKNATLALLKAGMNLYIGSWNPAFGKGLDDIAIVGNRPTYHPVTK